MNIDPIRTYPVEKLLEWLEELGRDYFQLPGIPFSRYEIENELTRREEN